MQIDSKKDCHDLITVRDYALRTVMDSSNRTTPPDLEKQLAEKFGIGKKQVKSVIRGLVAEGELVYTYEFGSTFLERSFNKPVRVSKHIVLQPPGLHHRSRPNDMVVQIKPGASFGAGNHPTTRLAIQAIEHILLGEQHLDNIKNANALDIGTGSGVLVITAILCGMKSGLGIDTDPCSVIEAAENVKINSLADRIAVSDQSLSNIREGFSLILANLRLPTLKKMHLQITEKLDISGYLVLSGIRDYELDGLLLTYEKIAFEKIWSGDELGWSAVALQRKI
jgi:ribosomal protein L11 methyltransferase